MKVASLATFVISLFRIDTPGFFSLPKVSFVSEAGD